MTTLNPTIYPGSAPPPLVRGENRTPRSKHAILVSPELFHRIESKMIPTPNGRCNPFNILGLLSAWLPRWWLGARHTHSQGGRYKTRPAVTLFCPWKCCVFYFFYFMIYLTLNSCVHKSKYKSCPHKFLVGIKFWSSLGSGCKNSKTPSRLDFF